ncbi:MAG: VOC family protein [Gammaproteobacteria bacterium]|nr:VOC family protein [Gammaproteobacteria bacterium]MCW8982509.1 VOC family protein [Gammaproteobacteria bacterium]
MVRALHHVSLLISDLERSQQFYQEILGLSLVERPKLQFDGLWFSLAPDGSQQLHLLLIPENMNQRDLPEHVGRDGHFALLVDNLPEYIERVERAGFAYTMSRSGRDAAFLRDPDGNGIELIAA